MAIKVNGTTVIDDSRALQNIASVDATTVAALGAAGVGGGTYGTAFFIAGSNAGSTDFFAGTANGTDIILGGASGTVVKSTDGTNFSNSGMGNTYNYQIWGMARNGSTIVTCNSNGRVARSTNNGASFSISNTGLSPDFRDIATDGSTYVTVTSDNGGKIYTTDGSSVTERLGYSGPGGRSLWAVAHNGSNLWLAGGHTEVSGTSTSIIAYSSNGTSWSSITSGVVNRGSKVSAIGYGNGYWVAGYGNGDIIYSANGTSWTYAATVPNQINSLAYNDGLWVGACSGGHIITSESHAGPWKASIYTGTVQTRYRAVPHSIGGSSTILVAGSNGIIQYTS
jgi:hypothetical protein